eukprot:CAMPEP_0173394416 /NCGR_PEP_ID=MMETSP1356-20130122/27296_1 /TAXON_ID=77927 ORGANISM="Hemiselmis virescens, Strain PCC157" /NCGR_SAMPLE_ID=MMETSP1356 /ASSEMBLY_ACC=CAM_ASM_000847 /LENGTH=302 /DNA_ID=CAMNT_0014352769 /DNA_START=317 /DNA_END=1222 /DNA_ORIENTATION=+
MPSEDQCQAAPQGNMPLREAPGAHSAAPMDAFSMSTRGFHMSLDEGKGRVFRPRRRSRQGEYPYSTGSSAPSSPASRPADQRCSSSPFADARDEFNIGSGSFNSPYNSPRAHPYRSPKQHSRAATAAIDIMGPRGKSFDSFLDLGEPIGGQPTSPPTRAISPMGRGAVAMRPVDANVLKARLPPIVPVQTYVAAMQELPQGARTTLSTCLSAWREGRMPQEQVQDFLLSVAWQSHALNEWSSSRASAGGPAPEEELLSLEDLTALMESASTGWDPSSVPVASDVSGSPAAGRKGWEDLQILS